jgi:hypothetical protein
MGNNNVFKNYFMTELRNINRQKMYSALNITGLYKIKTRWLTVGGHAYRVARTNPITALRYE